MLGSEFQRRKIAVVFNGLDADKNGFLERADFQALIDRWASLRGWGRSSAELAQVESIMWGWWEGIRALADEDGDDRLGFDEVLHMVTRLPDFADEVRGTALAMFDAIDANGDGAIGQDEHAKAVTVWTGNESDTSEIFSKLDINGDGHLSREEFVDLWYGYWVGDDPGSPSRLFFGAC
jgi:Ca2+-binding EF-hand superfamily protein